MLFFFPQMVGETKEEVQVVGVRDGPEPGLLELLLVNQDVLFIKEEIWESFDALVSQGTLKVTVERVGQRVSKIYKSV